MMIKIGAFGYGLAAILGAGAVLLASLNNPNWSTFLFAAVLVFIMLLLARKIKF